MTDRATPLNFCFRSFGNDETISTEDYFIIDDSTLVINNDFVNTVQLDSSGQQTTVIKFHLKDGVTIEKNFIVTDYGIKESSNTPSPINAV